MNLEPVYRVTELAKRWRVSCDFIRKHFLNEPGVIVISRQRRGVRIHRTILIPYSVEQRVRERYTVRGAL